ncbi:MAG: glycosyl hydrolase [Polyangiaceae bacterium]|nr:glycosyl hydrolase [Polyangiaceae bacterium]
MNIPRCECLSGKIKKIQFAIPLLLAGVAIPACSAEKSSSENDLSGLSESASVTSSAGTAPDCSALSSSPIYQVVNPKLKTNLLTASQTEAQKAASNNGFTEDHGTPFYASLTAATGLVGAHRMYSSKTNDFFWTINSGEIASATQSYGYVDQGINFYVSASEASCTQPVYRFLSGSAHRFAVSQADRDALTASGWTSEGIKFYAAVKGAAGPDGGTDAGPDSGTPDSGTTNGTGKTAFFGVVPTASYQIADDEWSNYKTMGVKSLRIHLEYDENWADIGNVVKKAKSLGIEVMMLVSYASYKNTDRSCGAPWDSNTKILCYTYDTDAKGLIAVLKDAVPYFSALGVKSWEIWNEENGYWNMPAGDYAKMIGDIYENFKYTATPWDPAATIVFGGLDDVNVGEPGGTNSGAQQYVKNVYSSTGYKAFKSKYGRSPFDAVGVHPYGSVSVDTKSALKFNYFASSVHGAALDTMKSNGDGNIPIWITELGSEQQNDDMQAAEVRAYMESAYTMPEVQRFFYFQYVYPGEYWGLVNWDRTPRKSLYEYTAVVKQYSN